MVKMGVKTYLGRYWKYVGSLIRKEGLVFLSNLVELRGVNLLFFIEHLLFRLSVGLGGIMFVKS